MINQKYKTVLELLISIPQKKMETEKIEIAKTIKKFISQIELNKDNIFIDKRFCTELILQIGDCRSQI